MSENWIKQSEDPSYIKALTSTESIESPAVGFIKPSNNKTTFDFSGALIRQNNTLISLLLEQNQVLRELQKQVVQIKQSLTQPSESPKEINSAIDELTKRIAGLNLGPEPVIPKKKGAILIFKNPSDILKEEVAKKRCLLSQGHQRLYPLLLPTTLIRMTKSVSTGKDKGACIIFRDGFPQSNETSEEQLKVRLIQNSNWKFQGQIRPTWYPQRYYTPLDFILLNIKYTSTILKKTSSA